MRCEWEKVKILDYCEKVTDGTHDSPKRTENGKYLITSRHIKNRNIDYQNAYKISEDDYNNINQRSQVNQWDILISMIGEYCGFCYIEENVNIDYAVKNVGILKANNKLKAKWLYYYLTSPKGKNILTSLRSGTSQPYLSLGVLRNLIIPIPPLSEQTAIVETLSALDDKIELNNAINKNLEEQAQALFNDMFPAIFDSNSIDTLEKLITFSNGKKRPDESGVIPVYGGNGILAYTGKYNAENCVIIGRVGAYCGNTFLSTSRCWISDNAIQAKSNTYTSQIFIYYLLKNASLPSRHIGTGQPLMTQGILNAIPCTIPNEDNILRFNDLCSPFQHVLDNNLYENNLLSNLRDTLLPKLMSGELDVSEIEL